MIATEQAKNRTLKENKYYHGVMCALIIRYRNLKKDEAHEWIKFTFGIESTASLTTTEFEELTENVRRHTEKYWNLIIPLPNE